MKKEIIRLKRSDGDFDHIHFEEIIRIKAEGNYVNVIVTEGRRYLLYVTMKAFYNTMLPSGGFCYANKSEIVNVKHIVTEKIKDSQLLMSDDKLVKTTELWDISKKKNANIIVPFSAHQLFLFPVLNLITLLFQLISFLK